MTWRLGLIGRWVSHGEGWVTGHKRFVQMRKSNQDKKERHRLTVFFKDTFAVGGVGGTLRLGFLDLF